MQKFKLAMKWLFGIFFVLAGVRHFVSPDFYLKIMPPYLPVNNSPAHTSSPRSRHRLRSLLLLYPRLSALETTLVG